MDSPNGERGRYFHIFDALFLIGVEESSDNLGDPEQHFAEAEQ